MWRNLNSLSVFLAGAGLFFVASKFFGKRSNAKREIPSANGPLFATTAVAEEMRGEDASADAIQERKYIDLKRWTCISRPQHKYACGVASLTAVFNYLYSSLGTGDLPPVTQEEVMRILGFVEPFGEIRFGPFTGNQTLIKWFKQLVLHFNVQGQATIFWKEHGVSKTPTMGSNRARAEIVSGLKDPNVAFIYHCFNHYMVPIGYEIDSNAPQEAYGSLPFKHEEVTTWFMFGDSSKTSRNIQSIKFDDISKDICMESPKFFNVRRPEEGIMTRRSTKRIGGNLHCFIEFRKDSTPQHAKQSLKNPTEAQKKFSSKRHHDSIGPEKEMLSATRNFVVSTQPDIPVEIFVPKKPKKDEQQKAGEDSEFVLEKNLQ